MNGNPDVTEEQHLDVIMRKTAWLFAACAEIGGILADVDAARRTALRHYGLNLGIAFQMIDDLLDFTSNESTLGKPVGIDLRGGKLTLPLIYLMQSGEAQRDLVLQALGHNAIPTHNEAIMELLRKNRTLDRVHEVSRSYAAKARDLVAGFPPSPARDALTSIPDFIVERDR
jgi:octaprenyl-diphosphate synthase